MEQIGRPVCKVCVEHDARAFWYGMRAGKPWCIVVWSDPLRIEPAARMA
jgi:hypothetical protein